MSPTYQHPKQRPAASQRPIVAAPRRPTARACPRRSPLVALCCGLALLSPTAAATAAAATAATHRPAATATATATAAGTGATAASTGATAPAPAPSHKASSTVLVIHGAGDGHGVGLSQWGAYGYSLRHWSDLQILQHYYQGTEIGHVSPKRIIKVLVNRKVRKVPIEAYVRGVVAAEMPSSWPKAALQAQAIASRTYAITDHAGGSAFDVYSDTRSQMYLGKAAETPASNAAVKETEGEIVTYEHKPAITFFFASSGGKTENVQDSFIGASPQPWLKGVADPYDQGPLHRWTVKIAFAKAERLLKGLVLGAFKGIEVVKRGFSPRIVSAYVLGSKGKTEVSGPEIEARLGLDCAWAYFFTERGGKLHREPDLSGRKPTPAEEGETPPSEPAPPEGEPSSGEQPSEGVPGPAGSTTKPSPPLGASGGVKAP